MHIAIALALACLLSTGGAPVVAQTAPQSQHLVQAGNFVHLGVIHAPTNSNLGGGQNGMAVEGSRWYYGCSTGVAVLGLPPIGGTANVISPCAQLPNIAAIHPTDRNVLTGGILPWQGRLVVSAYVYYDRSGLATASHYAGPDAASLAGPVRVGTDRVGMVAGYMGVIPQEWRALLGGPALTGQCCIPIISRSSFGPSFSVFDPADIGTKSAVPSKMLVGYPDEHKGLGPWDASPPNIYYGGTDQLGSVAFPPGTRSILLTGRHGDAWCYGPGTADPAVVGTPHPVTGLRYCYDPTDEYQGNHGPPYRPTVWAYDANDLVAVKQGTKQPWDVLPYAKWALPGMSTTGTNLLRAGYFDPATGRYYVGSTDSLDVHVFEVTNAVLQPPRGSPEGLTATAAGPGLVTFSWTPPSGSGWVSYALDAGSSPGASNVGTLPVTPTATSVAVATTVSGTFYARVRAVYGDGYDTVSNEIQFWLGPPGTSPPPTNFRAAASGSTITFSWDSVIDPAVQDVVIEAGSASGLSDIVPGMPVGKLGHYAAPNVPAGRYFVRLRALTAAGAGGPSDEVDVLVGTPAGAPYPPTGLAAGLGGGGAITLTWNLDAGSPTPTQYVVEGGSRPDLTDLGVLNLPPVARYQATSVPRGEYYVRVRAQNASGRSAPSNELRLVVP